MSFSQPTSAFRFRCGDARPQLGVRVSIALGLLALGSALFGLGIFHGFENGSCSTIGYSADYGPVPRCAQGVGWWMLLIFVGLGLLGGGALLSRTAARVGIPALFIAIGAPFIALSLRSGNFQLLQNTSSSTGKLSAGIFGACFVIAGVAWGLVAGFKAFRRLSGGSKVGGFFSAVVGVAVAFAIAAGAASAIGTAPSTTPHQASRGSGQSNPAVTHAKNQVNRARKLAACVTAAGADTAKIQACEAKYGS